MTKKFKDNLMKEEAWINFNKVKEGKNVERFSIFMPATDKNIKLKGKKVKISFAEHQNT